MICTITLIAVLSLTASCTTDLEHGKLQVVRMMQDRPRMRQFHDATIITPQGGVGAVREISLDDPFVRWCIVAYAQRPNGHRIVWDSTTPRGPVAECGLPRNGAPISIRIRDSTKTGEDTRPLRFNELWSACVFELLNARQAEEFLAVERNARSSSIDGDAYFDSIIAIEHQSMLGAKRFYLKKWKPWADEANHVTVPSLWFAEVSDDADVASENGDFDALKTQYKKLFRQLVLEQASKRTTTGVQSVSEPHQK